MRLGAVFPIRLSADEIAAWRRDIGREDWDPQMEEFFWIFIIGKIDMFDVRKISKSWLFETSVSLHY